MVTVLTEDQLEQIKRWIRITKEDVYTGGDWDDAAECWEPEKFDMHPDELEALKQLYDRVTSTEQEVFEKWVDDYMSADSLAYGLYKRALEKWGYEPQILMLAEEASELATAALHHIRGEGLDKVAEEIADTLIMIEQLYVHSGNEFWADVLGFRAAKLERLRERLDEGRPVGSA